MKRSALLCILLTVAGCLLPVVGLAGCSGLDAKAAYGTEMSVNAGTARNLIAGLQAATQPADAAATARAYLSGPARVTLQAYLDQATVNWFAYAFGHKQIYVSAAFYADLEKTAAISAELGKRAATLADPLALKAAQDAALDIIYYDMARRATKPRRRRRRRGVDTDEFNALLASMKAKLPTALGPVVDQGAQIFLTWTQQQIQDWIALAATDSAQALNEMYAALPDSDLVAAMDAATVALADHTEANADSVARQKAFLDSALKALIGVAGAALTVLL